MDRTDVLRVYDDDEFAEAYNDRFVLAPWPKHGIDFEMTLLEGLFDEDTRWIDLGCGTGWVLSQFPDVERGGLDLSPAMLRQAQAANPGVTFRNGDFTTDIEEFHGAWSVVSCMWMAYCYLESMPEVEALVANMVRWTAPGGSAFIPSVIDLEDLRPHVQVPYEDFPEVWHGRIAVTGYNWTWEEPNGNVNANMMAVHVGHFVRLLEGHFEKIEVVRYPVFEPGGVSRKAVVATGRRGPGETGETEIIWHPAPLHPEDEARAEAEEEAEKAAIRAVEQSAEQAIRDAQAVAEQAMRNAEEAIRHAEQSSRDAQAAHAAEAERHQGEVAARAAAADAERVEREHELAHLRHEVEWLREAYANEQKARLEDGEAVRAQQAEADAACSEHLKQLAIASHEADWLRETYVNGAQPVGAGSVDLSGTSSKRMAKEIAKRLRRRLPGGR